MNQKNAPIKKTGAVSHADKTLECCFYNKRRSTVIHKP